MNTQVYEVAGGWQAQDDELMIACFGHSAEDARRALEVAQGRARAIAARFASLPQDDEELTDEDRADIAAAREEIARGESRRVPVSRGHQLT